MIQFKSCTEYLFASKKCLILKGHVMFSWNVLAVGPGHWCHPCHPFVISLWNHAKPSSCRRRWPAVSSWRINRRCSIFLAVSFRSSTRTRKIRQVFSISLSKFLGLKKAAKKNMNITIRQLRKGCSEADPKDSTTIKTCWNYYIETFGKNNLRNT